MTHREDLFLIIGAALRGHQAYQETGNRRYGWEVGIKTWLLGSLAMACLLLALGATPVALLIWSDPEPFFWPIRVIAVDHLQRVLRSRRVRFAQVNTAVAESHLVPPPIPTHHRQHCPPWSGHPQPVLSHLAICTICCPRRGRQIH
jgi:hypothetical protein